MKSTDSIFVRSIAVLALVLTACVPVSTAFAETDEELIQENNRLQAEVVALKAGRTQFEKEKQAILVQVRSSVKAFDDYRTQVNGDLGKLQEEMTALRAENEQLKTAQAQTAEAAAVQVVEAAPAGDPVEVEALKKENSDLKFKIAEMEANPEAAAQAVNPEHVEQGKLHYNVGNFYFRNGEYAEAVTEYEQAISLMPDDPDTNYNLAYVYEHFIEDRVAALRYYKRYAKLAPAEEVKEIEEKILDLELYATVMESKREQEMDKSKVKWLDQTRPHTTTNFVRE